MTIVTLSGRRFIELTDDHWDEVEGWLALGARHREATANLVGRAVHTAMVPTTYQTRTTGLVTRPGAFVGAVFGEVSPLEAGRFQIVVLGSVIGRGAIVAIVPSRWLAPVRVRPAALHKLIPGATTASASSSTTARSRRPGGATYSRNVGCGQQTSTSESRARAALVAGDTLSPSPRCPVPREAARRV